MQEAPASAQRFTLTREGFPFWEGYPRALSHWPLLRLNAPWGAVLPKTTVPPGFLRPFSFWSGPFRTDSCPHQLLRAALLGWEEAGWVLLWARVEMQRWCCPQSLVQLCCCRLCRPSYVLSDCYGLSHLAGKNTFELQPNDNFIQYNYLDYSRWP